MGIGLMHPAGIVGNTNESVCLDCAVEAARAALANLCASFTLSLHP